MSEEDKKPTVIHSMIHAVNEKGKTPVAVISISIEGVDPTKPDEVADFIGAVTERFVLDTTMTDEGIFPVLNYSLVYRENGEEAVRPFPLVMNTPELFALLLSWLRAIVEGGILIRNITFIHGKTAMNIISHSVISDEMKSFFEKRLKILENILATAREMASKSESG